MLKNIILFILISLLIITGCYTLKDANISHDIPGKFYRVKAKDTIEAIAQKYKVSIDEIKDVNGLNHNHLQTGQILFLPNTDIIGVKINKLIANKPLNQPQKSHKDLSPSFLFPVPKGRIAINFSKDKAHPYDGIGIKAPLGSNVLAALDGEVLFVGDEGTHFGLLVIVAHQEPYITIYAQLHKSLVKTGQKLKRGQILGILGMSGGAKEPHLHFQIRKHRRPVNPLSYLAIKQY